MFEVLLVYIKVSLSKRLVKVAYREGGISPRVLSFPLYAETRTIFTDPVMRKEGVLSSGLVSGEYIMIAYRLQLIVCRNINDAEFESKGKVSLLFRRLIRWRGLFSRVNARIDISTDDENRFSADLHAIVSRSRFAPSFPSLQFTLLFTSPFLFILPLPRLPWPLHPSPFTLLFLLPRTFHLSIIPPLPCRLSFSNACTPVAVPR